MQTNLPEVTLLNQNGNAFAILGAVQKAMKQFYETDEAKRIFKEYETEAKSGDYDHLLQTTMRYCNVS